MQRKLLPEADRYARQNRRQRTWQKFVRFMACFVVFCTTYALILPAITLEKEMMCGIEEHAHNVECYTQVTTREVQVLSCTYESLGVHAHTDSCYDEDGALLCTQPTFLVHTHEETCYDAEGSLICQLPEVKPHTHTEDCYTPAETEPAHTHDDACYTTTLGALTCTLEESEEHTHTDSCYERTEILTCTLPETTEPAEAELLLTCGEEQIIPHTHTEEDGCYETVTDEEGNEQLVLVCDQQEVFEHIHDETCFVPEDIPVDTETLTCALAETEGHTHSETCYDESGALTCTLPESEAHTHTPMCYGTWILTCTMEEHTHNAGCYADITANLETAEVWEATLPELTGIWAEDLVAVAQSQLGYTESEANYTVEDGTLRGYTRYGAWNETPYAPWNTLFTAFCLHYAGVEAMPVNTDCAAWVTDLGSLYAAAAEHEPAPGELIFLDTDTDGAADRVGLVAEVLPEEEETPARLNTIQGDVEGVVESVTYDRTDAAILGYGLLPEQTRQFQLTAQTESGITVTITGDPASLPVPAEEVTVTAVEVVDEEIHALRDQMLAEENVDAEQHFLLDITLWHNDVEIEPEGSVEVTFSGFDTEGYYPHVYHIDTESEEVTNMEASKDEAGDVVVNTDHFSYYDVMLTATPSGTAIYYSSNSGNQLSALESGGTFYLNQNIKWGSTVTIKKDTTLDLNGHNIEFNTKDARFSVNSGVTFTIIDSSASATDTSVNGTGDVYGRTATFSASYSSVSESNPSASNSNTNSLTYYVTESVVNADKITTSESLKKHTVSYNGCGVIRGTYAGSGEEFSDNVIIVNGGTLKIQGGCIWNEKGRHSVVISATSGGMVEMSGGIVRGAGASSEGAGFYIGSGTLKLSGGYIVDGGSGSGGGIYMDSGIINMSGGVIAANKANSGGGIYMNKGTLNMTGGIISGNKTNSPSETSPQTHGGGIYAGGGTINMSGGYVTNNYKYGSLDKQYGHEHIGYGCCGGAGIALRTSAMNLSGGYITGNYSSESGGGIYAGFYDYGSTLTVSGGTIASNVANGSEGGGISVTGSTTATIIAGTNNKVYITNNATNTTYDWGGGGIFVQESGTLNIQNALITENSAGGYGGGVGACPTGETLIVHTDGAAIYGNTAAGENMSGGGNGKDYDVEVAKASSVFKSSGYQDYFCVKASDNSSYISLVTGEMVGGGAANWSGSCDEKAISISKTGNAVAKYLFGLTASPDNDAIASAVDVASVIITGNSSYTHGGGIMTNGGLILGKKSEVTYAPPSFEIKGVKKFLIGDTVQTSDINFTFQLLDGLGKDAKIIGTAKTNPQTGSFTIYPEDAELEQAGTYTYYLKEFNGEEEGVTYDSTIYKIKIVVGEEATTLLGVKFKTFKVISVDFDKYVEGSDTEESQTENTFKIHYYNSNGWSPVYVYAWGGIKSSDWPGNKMTAETGGWYTYTFNNVTSSGKFCYIFNNNSSQTDNSPETDYMPGGELWVKDGVASTSAPMGWYGNTVTVNSSIVSGEKTADGSLTLSFKDTAFTNTKELPVNLQITKVSTDGSKIEGISFTLAKKDGTTGATKQTDSNGLITFENLERGETYVLTEVRDQSSSTYMPAGPWEVVVADDGTITVKDESEKELTVTKKSTTTLILNEVTITNTPCTYELPATGGAGTHQYTFCGLLLIAAPLVYGCMNRRKRERRAAR